MPNSFVDLWTQELHIERITSKSWLLTADLKSALGSRAFELGQRLNQRGMDVHALVTTPFREESVRGYGELDPWEALWRLAPYCKSLSHLSCSDLRLEEGATIRQAFQIVENRLASKRAELIRCIRSSTPPHGWKDGRIELDRTTHQHVTTLVVEDWMPLRKTGVDPTGVHRLRVLARHRRRWPDSFLQELELSRFPNLTKIEWHTKCGGLRFDKGVLQPSERLSCLGIDLHVFGDSSGLPEVGDGQLNLLREVATTVEWRP